MTATSSPTGCLPLQAGRLQRCRDDYFTTTDEITTLLQQFPLGNTGMSTQPVLSLPDGFTNP
uniref:Uncharacterized protein n=1 Tax=Oryza punctata TaxID=4537 RepID=A0A0E0LZD7_ORYPU